MTGRSNLVQLAQRLLKIAEALEAAAIGPAYLQSNDAPDHVRAARRELLEATTEIQIATAGPADFLDQHRISFGWLSSLRWLVHFNILSHLPADSSPTPYTEVATKAAVPLSQLKSVARMAMTSGLLTEPTSTTVAHNSLSLSIERDPALKHWAHFITYYSAPMAAAFAEATERWGETKSLTETAGNIALGMEMPFFQYVKTVPGLAEEFAGYMRGLQMADSGKLIHVVNGFDWASLETGTHVVDVGGSNGQTAVALANAYPGLTFTVQDLPEVIVSSGSVLKDQPHSITSRIECISHDFFAPQPEIEQVTPDKPVVYFLRKILHDWPNESARLILCRLAEALQTNKSASSRVVIADMILSPPGTLSKLAEAKQRSSDLMMAQHFNGKERELGEWEALFHSVVPRLELKAWNQPQGSAVAILDVGLADQRIL